MICATRRLMIAGRARSFIMTHKRHLLAVTAFGAILFGLSGCDQKTEIPKSGTATPEIVVARPVTVLGTEYGFEVDGQAVPGIQTITFKNVGKEYHELQLVSLDRGYTVEAARVLLTTPGAAIPDWVKFNGGIWAIPAGAEASMTVRLDRGAYALLCFLEDEGRPWTQTTWRAGDGSRGAPHYARGMVNGFQVKGAEVKDAAPVANLLIEASDYAFQAPSEVRAGKTVVSLKNNGKEPHFAGLVRVPDGMPYESFTSTLLVPTPVAPAGSIVPTSSRTSSVAELVASGVSGGVGAISAGQQAWVTADLKPGTYVVVCLIPDPRGAPHAALGMLNKFVVR